jgi:hypothetical protein
MLQALASTAGKALITKAVGKLFKKGTTQAQKQQGIQGGIARGAINGSLYNSDPEYRAAVDAEHRRHIAATGYQWSTNSAWHLIAASLKKQWANIQKRRAAAAAAAPVAPVAPVAQLSAAPLQLQQLSQAQLIQLVLYLLTRR